MLKDTDIAYLAGIIDGEGTITLTRMHSNENRKPVITIASTDLELLVYLKDLVGGVISNKKNYKPNKHKSSYTLSIKKKETVFYLLSSILPYLKIPTKLKRAEFIVNNYNNVTPRNGKYTIEDLIKKKEFEEGFFRI